MSEMLDYAKAALASQPFSMLLKAEAVSYEKGAMELAIPISNDLLQQYGFVHGGVISYAADNALTFAAASMLQTAVVTSELKINYLRPAMGQRLIARAAVVHCGKTLAVCRCDVFVVMNNEERLCAAAQGTVSVVSSERKL